MAQEALQQRELARAQVELVARHGHHAAALVELDRAVDELDRIGMGHARGTPAQGAQPGRQLGEGERLDEVVVGAGVEAAHPVTHRVARGQHEDRHLGALGAQAARDVQPGQLGQSDVQDDRLDPGRLGRDFEALFTVGRELDDVAVVGQQARQQPAELGVVLHEEQVHVRASVAE